MQTTMTDIIHKRFPNNYILSNYIELLMALNLRKLRLTERLSVIIYTYKYNMAHTI